MYFLVRERNAIGQGEIRRFANLEAVLGANLEPLAAWKDKHEAEKYGWYLAWNTATNNGTIRST